MVKKGTSFETDQQDVYWTSWHDYGQKRGEYKIKDGKMSEKWWNSKGEPVEYGGRSLEAANNYP